MSRVRKNPPRTPRKVASRVAAREGRRAVDVVGPVVRDALTGLGGTLAEILNNAVASAVDDGLERIEKVFRDDLAFVERARAVAQKRGRQGRR